MRSLLVAVGALALSATPAGAAKVAIHPGCEFLLGSGQECLAPFPDDFYTRADRHADHGSLVARRGSLGSARDPVRDPAAGVRSGF